MKKEIMKVKNDLSALGIYFSSSNQLDNFMFDIDIKDRSFSDMKEKMKDAKKEIKTLGKKNKALDKNLTKEDLESYGYLYVAVNFILGVLNQVEAEYSKDNGKPHANDGRQRQHWIPKCYTKRFRSTYNGNNGILRSISNGKIEYGTYDDYFGETRENKGRFYEPEFEIALSKFEDDYGNELEIIESVGSSSSIYDFDVYVSTVFQTFFSLLYFRNKKHREKMEERIGHKVHYNEMINVFSSLSLGNEVRIIDVSKILPQDVNAGLSFAESPVFSEKTKLGEYYLMVPIDSKRILVSIPKDEIKDANPYVILETLTKKLREPCSEMVFSDPAYRAISISVERE